MIHKSMAVRVAFFARSASYQFIEKRVGRCMGVVLFGRACFFILALALPFFRSSAWWIRMFDFPRAQIAVLGLVVLPGHGWVWGQLAVYQRGVAVLLGFGILYQIYRILPYTPLAPRQVFPGREDSSADRFRLMIANVLMTNRDVEAFLALVRDNDPDIVLTMETDSRWEEALRTLETTYPLNLDENARADRTLRLSSLPDAGGAARGDVPVRFDADGTVQTRCITLMK